MIEADYVVVGSGAMGMAFTDVILTHTDATVAIVDRHDKPGGHWNDSYPFVRLHQPSAFYGVDSAELGSGRIDDRGGNAGLAELASGREVCAYYDQVMNHRFLPSGRVTHHPRSIYDHADGRISSIPSGRGQPARAHRAIVDASYMQVTVPSTRPPAYGVADGVTVIPPNGLPEADRPEGGYVIVGAGKTAMDAVLWLLSHEVDPAEITWITPRDSWLLNRAMIQPGPGGLRVSEQYEIAAEADSTDVMFAALEAAGHLLRIDPSVSPTMYRCATVTVAELEQLRRVEGIVRMGRVVRIEPTELVLDQGAIEVHPETLYVDCSADGLERRPIVPVFADGRITLQTVRACQQVFSAALIARVEADASLDLDAKNELATVVPHPDETHHFVTNTLAHALNVMRWLGNPALLEWLGETRLSPVTKTVSPEVMGLAIANLQRFASG